MWIRSQDKEILIKVDGLKIEKNTIVIETCVWYIVLGEYSTKEKALKVMDMIEQNIKNSFVAKTDYSEQYSENSRREMSVFQMPQDSEVE